MKLVIVESPTKAKTIEKFLGKDFKVTSSYGHIRDLPNNAAEIPEKIKKEKWTRLGINIENNFEPLYVIPDKKRKHVKELKKLASEASEVLLATDEDREGESISWHLLEVLNPKVPVSRLVFHEITKEAIKHSLETARNINDDLVRAQETRRLIDRLYGYSVSPLLWKKVKPRLSAGRVQSVAMKLLVIRERARIAFKSAVYWDLKAVFKTSDSKEFEAELTHVNDKRVAAGKDFDPNTGKLVGDKVVLLDQKTAEQLQSDLKNEKAEVVSVESKPFTQKPSPPFTTSTLQQDANRKFSYSARRTMTVAQRLYENGFITYMRTDSTTLSEEALTASRNLISEDFGKEFLPEKPRLYKTKVRNAQEAHEAIRPAGSKFTDPSIVKDKLGLDAFKLYELIWMRTLASQMKDARGTRVGVQIECKEARFRASGKTIEFPGFLRAYVEGSDDPEAELADKEKILPPLKEKDPLDFKALDALQHETKAPARYTEGSLIKELERLGIGRPSTWATIVDVVLSRNYAFKKGSALVPTFLAMVLTKLMERYFETLVDFDFTAKLEDDLDAIARGEADNQEYLTNFYHGNGHPGLDGLVKYGEENIDPRDVCGFPIGTATDGKELQVRIGRYGPFLTNDETTAGISEILAPDELTVERAQELIEEAAKGPQSMGPHPDDGKPVYLKTGRYGPYVQWGDQEEGSEEKPKMASLLDSMTTEDVDLELAVKLLSLPRSLGTHPESKEEIVASNGRYGPYIKCGSDTRSLGEDYNPLDVTLEDALYLLSQPKRRGRGAAKKPLKEFGLHPVSEKPIVVKTGQFGPYVTDGTLNASIPAGRDIQSLTMEDAVNLLDARAVKVAEKEAQEEADEALGASDDSKKESPAKKKSTAKKKSSTKKKSASKSKSKAKKKTTSKKK